MYAILVNDFVNNKQQTLLRTDEYNMAVDRCKSAAEHFLALKEGSRYMGGKIYFNKNEVKKRGHFLTYKDNGFFIKITVYYKEPNGAIYSGEVKKIKEFYTAFTSPNVKVVENPRNIYDRCLEKVRNYVRTKNEGDAVIEKINNEIDDMDNYYVGDIDDDIDDDDEY